MEGNGQGVSSIAVFDGLTRLAPANVVICGDVGNNAYSFGRYFETQDHSFLMSGYLGSIGFALPAAMGAFAAVEHERPIIAVAGDGGLCQYLAEITTLVKYKMSVKVIVLNNNELGKISKEQRAAEFDVWATSLVNPSFAAYAESCGALGIQVKEKAALDMAIQQLLKHDGPGLLEVHTDVALI
ncbi:MAG: thiamine pyrophosphate-dependent enzyme [Bacteroidota bacterium]